MKKTDAIKLFGKTQVDLAKATYRTRSAICQWGDVLDKDKTLIVLGAAVMRGVRIPEHLLKDE